MPVISADDSTILAGVRATSKAKSAHPAPQLGHVEPQCWTIYPELRRPARSPVRPSDSSSDHFPARVGVQSAPTKPSRVDGLDRGPTRDAGGSLGWSASVGNSLAGFRGARPGWSAVDGRPAGGGFPGRQQPPSDDARWNHREDRGNPAHRSSAGLGSRRVARLEPDPPEHALRTMETLRVCSSWRNALV